MVDDPLRRDALRAPFGRSSASLRPFLSPHAGRHSFLSSQLFFLKFGLTSLTNIHFRNKITRGRSLSENKGHFICLSEVSYLESVPDAVESGI